MVRRVCSGRAVKKLAWRVRDPENKEAKNIPDLGHLSSSLSHGNRQEVSSPSESCSIGLFNTRPRTTRDPMGWLFSELPSL